MDKIRFGIIGCGYISRKAFIPALINSNSADLVAVASRSIEKAEAYAKEFNCVPFDNYIALLSRQDINAVYIATPPSTHEKIIIAAAAEGKHILCEKPLTVSYNSAKKIVSYCKNSNVGIFEGFMYQFHSQHQKVRDLVGDGQIGKPILFTASFGFPPIEDDNYRYTYELGGGACLDAGSYTIHAARHFFQREPIDIHSTIYKNGCEVDIHGAALLDFGDSQTAQLSFGFNNYYRNTYSIWGTKGQITVERAFSVPAALQPKIIVEKQDYYKEIICDSEDHFLNEINYFSKMINNQEAISKWYMEILSQTIVIDKIKG
jgi:dTDP-3,4-didehydro-2,6-dideoxy-alpha-D-glucose 3-reductase